MQKNNKCYDTLVKHHIDNLMLLFFKDIGPVLQTCLTQFQSGAPLVPLIKDEMVQLFTKIMQFFIKWNVLEEASSNYKLISVDVTKKENRMESAVMELPTATSNLLLKSSCSKERKIKFRCECTAIPINIVFILGHKDKYAKYDKQSKYLQEDLKGKLDFVR